MVVGGKERNEMLRLMECTMHKIDQDGCRNAVRFFFCRFHVSLATGGKQLPKKNIEDEENRSLFYDTEYGMSIWPGAAGSLCGR